MGSRDYVERPRLMTIRELEELLRGFWEDKEAVDTEKERLSE